MKQLNGKLKHQRLHGLFLLFYFDLGDFTIVQRGKHEGIHYNGFMKKTYLPHELVSA